jgi:hypothetical protein
VFPKDVRSSAQGLFNLLILGVGMVLASQLFPRLQAMYSSVGPGGKAVVDYRSLFLIPTGMAAVGMLLLGMFFKPPTRRPEDPAPDMLNGERGFDVVPNPPPAPGPAADPSATPANV